MLIHERVFRISHAPILLAVLLAGSTLTSRVAGQDLSAYTAARYAPLSPAQRRIASAVRMAAEMAVKSNLSEASTATARYLRLSPEGMIDVYIYVKGLTQSARLILQRHGVQVRQSHDRFGVIHAAVAVEALEAVAALPFVRWIGLPLRGTLRTGSVTSLGDVILGAAEARNTFGVDGSGIRVGIVSDSLIHQQDSVSSGDLPPDVTIVNGADGSHLMFPTDEGRALAEIIHDLAPGASLLFHSGFSTGLAMVRAIEALVAAGADMIVDDIGFFDEPVFEDGMVAQSVQNAIDSGVVYVTAAGNDADRHYRGVYVDQDPGDSGVNFHDFGEGDTTLDVELLPGSTMSGVLQWPNRFDGSGNTADYDLLVFDATGSVDACTLSAITGICLSTNDQENSQAPPIEIVVVSNNSATTITVTVVVNHVSGEALLLDIHFNRAARLLEHAVAGNSMFGHPCVRDALAVGAINVNDPGFIEFFSSRGPCEMVFPDPESRPKPDLVAADGVLTSLPGFRPFFGTSAAAPHVAAIAALLIDAAGGPGVLSNTQIIDTLRQSAVDLGVPGFDHIFGHGAVDAVETLSAFLALHPSPNSQGQSDAGGGGGCSILSAEPAPAFPLLAALGNIFLPLVVIVVIRTWRRYYTGK